MRSSERFRNQQNSLGFSRTKTRIGKLGRVADDSYRKFGMVRAVAHRVKKRFAHIEGGAIENKRVGSMLPDQFVDGDRVARREYFIACVAQRKTEELCNLRCVVNEQDAAQSVGYFLLGPVPGNRFFLPTQGSRSITHIRPPAV